ncbi:recombinase family protein [Mesorhizobium sp. BHbsci]
MPCCCQSIAEFERDLISERVKSGLAAAKARGRKLGRQPGQRPSRTSSHRRHWRSSRKAEAIAGSPEIWRSARIRLLISSNAIARVANEVVMQISAIRWSVSKGCSGWKTHVRLAQRNEQNAHVPDIGGTVEPLNRPERFKPLSLRCRPIDILRIR